MFKNAIHRAINAVGYDVCRLSNVSLCQTRTDGDPAQSGTRRRAMLYADRVQALDALPRGGVVAEIGVAAGDFSAAAGTLGAVPL